MSGAERMARFRSRQRADQELLIRLLTTPAVRAEARALFSVLPELAQALSEGVRSILREHLPFAVTDVSDGVTDAASEGFSAHANGHAHEGTDARGYVPLVTSSPTEKRDNDISGSAPPGWPAQGDFEQVRCVLEPVRGYVHDEQLLQRLATTFPAVDLEVEAIGMAEWLNRTANRTRKCSKAFLANWVKRAATVPTGPHLLPPAAERPRSALARVLHQIATDPVEGPSTWH